MPSISVMSLRRAMRRAAGSVSSAASKYGLPALVRRSARKLARMRWNTRTSLKSQQLQERPDDDIRLARGIGDRALSFDFHLQIGNRGGGHGVIRGEIAGADQTTDVDGLAIVTHSDVPRGLNDEHAIGQRLHDLRGQVQGHVGA